LQHARLSSSALRQACREDTAIPCKFADGFCGFRGIPAIASKE
jgi:hypothetical protein